MADSKIAIAFTLVHEGGFQKDEDDSGNWTGGRKGIGELKGTKYGISAHEFPNEDIVNLTPERATEIYQEGYWKPHYSEIGFQPLANKLFDLGVLMGVGTVVKLLQGTLALPQDGIVGPNTVAHINGLDGASLTQAFATALVSHAIGVANGNPDDRKDLASWIRRINCPNCQYKH